MALARKKQDEKNLKTLRELVSLPCNKYCFDCNQRGPTYVNVTIGSFVCTKCSGMLRGLTPPHRVKSISMASFTTEEIDLLKSRGNDYCRRTWLGLYDGTPCADSREDHTVRDFMVDKYERKRYYLEPQAVSNGHTPKVGEGFLPKPVTINVSEMKPSARQNGSSNAEMNRKNTEQNKLVDFVADFSSADIFSAVNNNNSGSTQTAFANFDNNPAFNNSSMPALNTPTSVTQQPQNKIMGPPAPPEDRYAALKDLDNALKAQSNLDWNSGSSSSLQSSPTPAGSVYSSPSPQGSLYGSPSQGQFASLFPSQESSSISNPFNTSSIWGNATSCNIANGQNYVNPFRSAEPVKMNGISYNYPNAGVTATGNGTPWIPNPFKLGTASGGNSSNPFL